ncbi:hypothetical protein [Geodermatophilus siccatus]|uniref:hypothetical protein n=1 Tax=Geodermatophilus siccatus TaxID=1137991 RepID=UPI0015879FBA|nr:hypothetical protein [Geodermatophilus siccatus]
MTYNTLASSRGVCNHLRDGTVTERLDRGTNTGEQGGIRSEAQQGKVITNTPRPE